MAKSKIEKLRKPISRIYAIFVLLLILFSQSPERGFFNAVLFSIGLILVSIAATGRLWCNLYVSGYKTRLLIDQGPYSMCRNPLYFFSLIGVIGVGLASEMVTVLILLLVPYAILYPFVIKAEEEKLKKKHGDIYEEYCRKTPRFIPQLKLFTEPDEYEVMPKIFKKEMLSAVWFIWVIAFLKVIEGLHMFGIVPVLFTLH